MLYHFLRVDINNIKSLACAYPHMHSVFKETADILHFIKDFPHTAT